MSAEDSLSTRQLGMVTEAARRHAAREAGIAHDAPEAPQVVGVGPGPAGHPEATHGVTVRYEDPEAVHQAHYMVNPEKEYMHKDLHVRRSKTELNQMGRPMVTTRFTP